MVWSIVWWPDTVGSMAGCVYKVMGHILQKNITYTENKYFCGWESLILYFVSKM